MDMSWAHWNFIGRLVDATGVSVTAPIYPLAPEHKCEKLIPQMQELFGQLAEKYGAANMTVMGDSAGGGLSLALAHALRDSGRPQPARLILLSPWLDVTATHPDQPELEKYRTALESVGNAVEYHEYSKMFHVWMLIPIPEGKRVMQQISDFLIKPM